MKGQKENISTVGLNLCKLYLVESVKDHKIHSHKYFKEKIVCGLICIGSGLLSCSVDLRQERQRNNDVTHSRGNSSELKMKQTYLC